MAFVQTIRATNSQESFICGFLSGIELAIGLTPKKRASKRSRARNSADALRSRGLRHPLRLLLPICLALAYQKKVCSPCPARSLCNALATLSFLQRGCRRNRARTIYWHHIQNLEWCGDPQQSRS